MNNDCYMRQPKTATFRNEAQNTGFSLFFKYLPHTASLRHLDIARLANVPVARFAIMRGAIFRFFAQRALEVAAMDVVLIVSTASAKSRVFGVAI